MRLPLRVRRLLIQALKEEDPQRATELFLAARLLYIVYSSMPSGGAEIKKIMDKISALDAGLESIYVRLKALLEPAKEGV